MPAFVLSFCLKLHLDVVVEVTLEMRFPNFWSHS